MEEKKTLSFYTKGKEFTNFLRAFISEGRYAKLIQALKSGGMKKKMIKDFFFYKVQFEGDSREGDLGIIPDEGMTNSEFAKNIICGIKTVTFNSGLEDFTEVFHERVRESLEDDVKEQINALFNLFDEEELCELVWREAIPFNTTDTIYSGNRSFSGVIVPDGTIIECGDQMHNELYRYLLRLNLSSSSDWINDDKCIHISCSQVSGSVANEIANWDMYSDRSNATKEQIQTLFDNRYYLTYYGFGSRNILLALIDYVEADENHGGKYNKLSFLKRFYPNVKLPQFSKEEIPNIKNCIRTSPKYSMPGLLTSKFDIDENSVNEIKADFEKYRLVVGNQKYISGETGNDNELFYFYQEYLEGVNGVCHYIQGKFSYSCSSNQGDVVNGKEGNYTLSENEISQLEPLCKDLGDNLNKGIQIEFVSNGKDVYIVQLRTLEETQNFETRTMYNKEKILYKGKSFSMGYSDELTIDDVLIIDSDCESHEVLGKKAVIVKNDVEFSHALALSFSLNIPSIYAVGDIELPEKFKLDTKGVEGFIMKV